MPWLRRQPLLRLPPARRPRRRPPRPATIRERPPKKATLEPSVCPFSPFKVSLPPLLNSSNLPTVGGVIAAALVLAFLIFGGFLYRRRRQRRRAATKQSSAFTPGGGWTSEPDHEHKSPVTGGTSHYQEASAGSVEESQGALPYSGFGNGVTGGGVGYGFGQQNRWEETPTPSYDPARMETVGSGARGSGGEGAQGGGRWGDGVL